MRKFWLVVAFLSLAIIWGGAFVAIKISVYSFPPISAAAIRLLIATIYVFLLYRLMDKSMRLPPGVLGRVWLAGLFTIGFPFALVFWGEQSIAAGLAGIINGTVPIWTTGIMYFVHIYRRQQSRYSPKVWLGVLLGFVGMAVIFYPKLDFQSGLGEFWGTLAVVGMALCYAVSNVMNGFILKSKQGISIPANVFHHHFVSTIFLVALALALEPSPQDWIYQTKWEGLVAILFLAIISGATALIIYYYLIREIGSIRTAAVTYLIPIGSIALDFAVIGTVPHMTAIIGTAFILIAVFFIQSAPR